MLHELVTRLGRTHAVRRVMTGTPGLRETTRRFLGGVDAASAVITAEALHEQGVMTTLHVRRPEVRYSFDAEEHVREYDELGRRLSSAGAAPRSEISVKLAQLGLHAPGGWHAALGRLEDVVATAAEHGLAVTLDMEGEQEVEPSLAAFRIVRGDHPSLGVSLQANLRRTEDDCAALADAGARVRLVKGAYAADADIAWTTSADIEDAFVRCLAILMQSTAYPMVATHDPRMVEAARGLARRARRRTDSWELQRMLGVRPSDTTALVRDGLRVRVYVPYGPESYASFVDRMAERPSNLRLLAHALVAHDDLDELASL